MFPNTQGLGLRGQSASYPLTETTAFTTCEALAASPRWKMKVKEHVFNHAWKYLLTQVLRCVLYTSSTAASLLDPPNGGCVLLRERFEMTCILKNWHYFALTQSLCGGAFFSFCLYRCFNNLTFIVSFLKTKPFYFA